VTVPIWSSTVVSPLDHVAYSVSMVGSDPAATYKHRTTIMYLPIALRIHFPDGGVLDPTAPLACTGAGAQDVMSVAQRVYNSPLFVASPITSNGQNLAAGTGANGVQLIDGFQRANFWSQVNNTRYGVSLTQASGNPLVLDVTAPYGSASYRLNIRCGGSVKQVTVGVIDIDNFDAMVQGAVAQYATPTLLPIVLTYNVVESSQGQCCILGYHNAIPTASGTQTYAVGGVFDSGLFTGVDDITVMAHEIAEWMDDPFGTNWTPAWGNIGQVKGCQNNLEVGDPLSGSETALTAPDGFTYHFQDLAFMDWFYRTPAKGTGGKYSFMGGLTAAQGVCR
jgi:hypothetical protein